MSELAERMAALSPERRLLLELLKKEKQGAGPAAGPGGAEALRSEPFCMLTAADRERLPEGVEDAYPISMLQLGMIYHMQLTLHEEVPAYHNVNSFHVRSPFAADAMQRAVQRVVDRHPMLRTAFDLTTYSEPLQLVHRRVRMEVPVVDLRSLPREEGIRQLETFHRGEERRVFDLSRPPLMRLHIHRFGEEEFHVTLTEIHAVSEGWSTSMTLGEIHRCFTELMAGRPLPEEPPPAFLYRDFILIERHAMQSREQREFWREKLAGCSVTRLPRWPEAYRDPRPGAQRKPTGFISPKVRAGLERLAAAGGVPIKSVLLAAHLKVLSLISGQADVLTGLQTHGRPERLDADKAIGVYINNVPLRFRLPPVTWRELVRQVFAAETELIPFRRYPLALLQRDWGTEPLLETAFAYLNFHPVEKLLRTQADRLSGTYGRDRSVTHFALHVTFHVREGSDDLLLLMEYDDRQLSTDQIRRLRGYFETVLADMAAHPDLRHERRGFLGAAEERQVLQEWNRTATPYALDGCLHHLIEAQVDRTPEAIALTFAAESLSYRELDQRANRIANALITRGVGPGVPVGLYMERSVELVLAMLAVLKAGGAYVPLDPEYPIERLAFMAEETGISLVLTQERLAAGLGELPCRVLSLDAESAGLARWSNARPASGALADDLVYVLYTSGSTGRPKGSMLAHRGICNRLLWMRDAYGIGIADVVLQKTPFSFDVSVWEFFLPLLSGARLVLAQPGGHRDPDYLRSLIARERVTTMHFVPSLLQVFLELPSLDSCSSLRRVICSGEALPAELERRFFARLDAELHNLYGPTEASIDVTAWACDPSRDGAAVPIGRPIANTTIYILDTDFHPVPIGTPGELYIGGVGLARGYAARPDLTADRFIPAPYGSEPGARLYRSGDVARFLPDGAIEFLGRVDHQVKIRGLRVELGEIEALLMASPDVQEAVVLAREDQPGDRRLVAYVVPRPGSRPDTGLLRASLRARLPEYMVPAAFVYLDALPITSNGKLDRRALPAPQAPESTAPYAAPQSELESMIVEILRDVLQVDRLGVDDNFFDLGGNSLSLLRVHGLLNVRLGSGFSLMTLFRHPTARRLAAHLNGGGMDPVADARHAAGRRQASAAQGQRRQQARGRDKR